MKKGKTLVQLLVASAVLSTILAACGKSEVTSSATTSPSAPTATPDTRPKDPVTIKMYNHFNNISDARFQQFIVDPLKTLLPTVTVENVKHAKGSTLEELVAAGQFPDLYYGSNVGFPSFLNMELQNDTNELIKKHNVDLGKFEPWAVDAIKNFGPKGEFFGIPFAANIATMIYNKDIFDKFGVAYPKDGMTWDEVIDLGKKLTRKDGDVQYIGFNPVNPTDMASGMSLPYLDDKTKKSTVNNDNWKKVFDVFQKAYSIPGYKTGDKYIYDFNSFMKDRNVAMMPIWALQILNYQKELETFKWDIVSYPSFKDQPGRGREVDIHMLAISNVSKNKDAALEVLKAITSPEVQKIMSENGTPSVLNNDDIRKAYGSKLPLFQGKNVQALFKTKPGTPHPISKYDGVVRSFVDGARKDIAEGAKDLNTIIREIEEQSNKKLAETP